MLFSYPDWPGSWKQTMQVLLSAQSPHGQHQGFRAWYSVSQGSVLQKRLPDMSQLYSIDQARILAVLAIPGTLWPPQWEAWEAMPAPSGLKGQPLLRPVNSAPSRH